ncbi:MAG: hypothetical protein WAL29_07610 [Bacteroidales bacterium]
MKRIILLLIVVITLTAVNFSCYYDNEESLYPVVEPCDTANVTFSGKIKPLLANNCLSCHSNTAAASSANGIRLENYADVVSRSTAVAGAMKHTGGYSPMPKNGGMLKPCLIAQFEIWVTLGLPNN